MSESGNVMTAVLPAGQYSSEFVRPCEDQTFNPLPPLVSAQRSAALRRRLGALFPMPRDYLNAAGSAHRIERITVIGAVPDKSLWQFYCDKFIDASFDKGPSYGIAEAVYMVSGRPAASATAMSIGPLSRLVFLALRSPFFATMKVPSMKYLDKSTSPSKMVQS